MMNRETSFKYLKVYEQSSSLTFWRIGFRHHSSDRNRSRVSGYCSFFSLWSKARKRVDSFITDIDLSQWGGSSLTDKSLAIPQGGLQADIIPSTYVPGRNTVFMAIALSLAEAKNARAIYLGINAVDYSGYPDCRPEYLAAYQKLANLSSKAGVEGNAPQLVAPLVKDSKVDIVRRALELNVPIAETWSCYQGGITPCGLCDSCRIRDRALIEAGRSDLTSNK
jgi:7-cyano-7-deazaguanine synthase